MADGSWNISRYRIWTWCMNISGDPELFWLIQAVPEYGQSNSFPIQVLDVKMVSQSRLRISVDGDNVKYMCKT